MKNISSGEDYYDYIARLNSPKDDKDYEKFLQCHIEELAEENSVLRKKLGIVKRVYNGHLGTYCEE